MNNVFRLIFSDKTSAALSFFSFILTAVFLFALPNISLIARTLTYANGALFEKIRISAAVVASAFIYSPMIVNIVTFLIAILFGLNIGAGYYYFRYARSVGTGKTAIGVGGALTGVFGAGCAVCGGVALSPFLSFFGASALVSFMPFGGVELGVLGAIALAVSLTLFLREIRKMRV